VRNDKENLIVKLTFDFAIEIIQYSKILQQSHDYALSNQLLRAGISIGAALYVQHQILKTKRQPTILTAHTGTSYTNEAIIELLNEKGISFTHFEDEIIFDRVTDCMING
jgi:hypothetical protein